MNLQNREGEIEVRIFLLADVVSCPLRNQTAPNGFYNIQRMLKSVISHGGEVQTWGSCADARGLRELKKMEGVELSNMSQLCEWTVGSDRVLVF